LGYTLKEFAVQRLRALALKRLREAKATFWIVAPPNKAQITHLNETEHRIKCATKKELQHIISKIETKIKEFKATYNIKAPVSTLLNLLDEMEAGPTDKYPMLPLYVWRSFFKNGEYPYEGMDEWPIHARIVLDAFGQLYDGSRHPKVSLLEATMFEDMATLFNLVKCTHEATKDPIASNELVKRQYALCRSSLMAAIHFVESYVNGLALDYFINNKSTLDSTTKSSLLDWDFKRARPKYLSLRQKIIKYQQIILDIPQARIQETNSPEMTIIVSTAKTIRDAIAHPSPALDIKTMDTAKERSVLGVDLPQTETVVDAAVTLVRRLEETIHGSQKRLFWLYDRNEEGVFPDESFQ
jgi:hypothetical protein